MATRTVSKDLAVVSDRLPAVHDEPNFEINQLIDKGRKAGPYSSRELAHAIVAQLRKADPGLLSSWLDGQAENLLWMEINRQDRSDRAGNRTSATRSVFAAAEMAQDGAERRQVLTSWLTTRYVNSEGLRMEFGTMRKADVTYVASRHRFREQSSALQAAFMEAVARKLGRGTVADHFDEEKLSHLWQSIASS
jgi:hypothetical protein